MRKDSASVIFSAGSTPDPGLRAYTCMLTRRDGANALHVIFSVVCDGTFAYRISLCSIFIACCRISAVKGTASQPHLAPIMSVCGAAVVIPGISEISGRKMLAEPRLLFRADRSEGSAKAMAHVIRHCYRPF